jgi:hypothetical protein
MEKEELLRYIELDYSTYKISEITGKSRTSIRYWLKKYDISTNYKPFKDNVTKEYGEFRFCPKCKKDVEIGNFYQRRGKENSSVYCKSCTSLQTLERQRRLKQELVDYKGGACTKCGYNKYIGALEFHHLDPTKKDFTIAHRRHTNFNDEIRKELDKCILVCSNCHREIHNEMAQSFNG